VIQKCFLSADRIKDNNTLRTIKRRKAKLTCHILLSNCLLEHVTEGNMEGRYVTGSRRRRSKQLLDNFKERESIGN
jgi:hypothetical protein